jgi:thiol:disulfide interchange protein
MAIRLNEELDPNEGPGLGCFTVQAILFAAILLLIPIGVFSLGWPVWLLTALLVIALILLFFISMTSVFLLRVFFAARRTGRGRTYGATAAPVTIDTGAPAEPDAPTAPASTPEPADDQREE